MPSSLLGGPVSGLRSVAHDAILNGLMKSGALNRERGLWCSGDRGTIRLCQTAALLPMVWPILQHLPLDTAEKLVYSDWHSDFSAAHRFSRSVGVHELVGQGRNAAKIADPEIQHGTAGGIEAESAIEAGL